MADDDALPEPTAPADLNWPRVQTFDNGVAVLRSGWTMANDVVLGIRSGGAARTGYSHDVPNRNAIALFVDGEYMIAVPGRASYRSPLRREWDWRTTSQNTITLDERNQVRERQAEIIRTHEDEMLMYLVSDATGSYFDDPELVSRHVLFVRDATYILIWDEIKLRQEASVQWQMHFANYDDQGEIEPYGDGQWRFTRPGGSLRLWLAGTETDEPTVSDGIMHTGYSYSPGGPNEGEWGSSFKLQATTSSARRATEYVTVVVPRSEQPPGSTIRIQKHNDEGATRLTVHGDGWRDELRLISETARKANGAAGHIEYVHYSEGEPVYRSMLPER
ncbi:heparinase II/III family protein [Phycisphaerales bacterium AB-hyl4]|uniref:Heparinase II/III family protein n=1 Tax=Natronomicrosphaera hydrolytica TaxID=3242702 RepID=A0ABV4U790_9BACT